MDQASVEFLRSQEVPFDQGVAIVPVVDGWVVEKVAAEFFLQVGGVVFLLAISQMVEQCHGGEEPGGFDKFGKLGSVMRDLLCADNFAAMFTTPIAADNVTEDVFGTTQLFDAFIAGADAAG